MQKGSNAYQYRHAGENRDELPLTDVEKASIESDIQNAVDSTRTILGI